MEELIYSEEHRFYVNLLQAASWFDDAFGQNIEAAGFQRPTRAETYIFACMAAGKRQATEIARSLGVSRQAISQIIGNLERRGMVISEEDPNDRRARIVRFRVLSSEEGDLAAKILVGIVELLERRVGKEAVDMLRKALAADWGQPPVFDPASDFPLTVDRPSKRRHASRKGR